MCKFLRVSPVALLAATLVFPLAAPAQPPMGLDRIVLTERDAVLLAPPVVVADGIVTQAEWSGDGKYVVAARAGFPLLPAPGERPVFEAAVVLWNKETQRSRTVWRASNLPDMPRINLQWLGRSPIALGTVDVWKASGPLVLPGKPPMAPPPPVRQRWLARLDARTGAFRLVSQVPEGAEVQASPTRPLAFLYSDQTSMLRFVRADGTFTDPVTLPEGGPMDLPRWNDEGDAVLMGRLVGQKAPEVLWFSIDPATGRSQRLADRPQQPSPPTAPDSSGGVRLVQRQATLAEVKTIARIRPLWLEAVDVKPDAEQPRALLSSDAEWGKLSPGGDAVLYLSNGAALVCPLHHMPKEAYLAARAAALRQTYISNGKQLGLGIIMYSQDYDDTLPSADEDIQALILPYVKSASLFDGFRYTFPGGKISDIKDPANTPLGFIPVEGGKIRVFVDGHVTFEPGP